MDSVKYAPNADGQRVPQSAVFRTEDKKKSINFIVDKMMTSKPLTQKALFSLAGLKACTNKALHARHKSSLNLACLCLAFATAFKQCLNNWAEK